MPIQIHETHTLLEVQRRLNPMATYFLDTFFGREVTFDTKHIDFDVVDEERRIAPFVSPMAQGRVMRDQGYMTRRFEPAYLKPKHVVDPTKPLERMPGESYGGSMSAEARFNAHVANNIRIERDMITRRWELMAAQAVIDGQVIVEGEDYPTQVVDFGRDPSLTITAATPWNTNADVDIVADIDDWVARVNDLSGRVVTKIHMSNDVWPVFRKNNGVKELLETRRGSNSEMETGPGTGLPIQFKGTLGANLSVYTYSESYEDNDGNKQPVMPAGTVVLTCEDISGVRAFGAIMDARAGYRALPIFPKMYEQDDPSVIYTLSQSAPLMIPKVPNATAKATVL